MGTTIIVVAITRSPTGYQASVAHAGDSRAYLFRQGTLSLWTKDHTLMEERLALNLITAGTGSHSPPSSCVNQSPGNRS